VFLGFTYPTLFFGSDASRAGTGWPGTLVCRRCGAFRCCVLCYGGGGVPKDKIIIIIILGGLTRALWPVM